MKHLRTTVFGVTLVVAGVAVGAPERTTGPVAVYWMSAATSTGMGGMMGGGGQRPNMAQMMMGGGYNPNAVTHTLVLQLGSARRPQGDPTAEHDPPPGLGAGPVLPLLTPQAQPAHEEAEPGPPPQYRQPHGRMLIFWGCGEHAGPNQPYVIDFAHMAEGEGAQQFMALARALAINGMQPPSPARNATYGEWPNQRSETSVPSDGSLTGEHVVRGDYTPDIRFSLAPSQDFLPPFQMTANQRNPSGSASLGWRPVDGAQGYFANMIGAQGQDEVVMWTSSQVQASAFGVPDYLSDGEIARLVASHVLMSPGQTACAIPAEAMQAAGRSGFFNLVAYGGETNIAFPPRPPAPQVWHIDWTVKVRYRSSTAGIVGMDMSRMGREDPQGRPQQQQPRRPGLGSFIPGGVGGFIP
jgi:hypothetical protein